MQALKILLCFLLLFNFPIPFMYNSLILVLGISGGIYIAYRNQLLPQFIHLVLKKNVFLIITFIFLLIPISIFVGIAHFTFDFTIIKANVLTLVMVLTGLLIYPILINGVKETDKFQFVLHLIVKVFIIQSCIQILAFVFTPISDLVHFFQKDVVSNKNQGGIRALALTGNPFFDLSSGYGMVFILFMKYIIDYKNHKFQFRSIFTFILLFVGSFFAGRTAFVGLLLAFMLYFLSKSLKHGKVYNIGKVVFLIGLFALGIYFVLPSNVKTLVDERLLPFAFEFVYAYIDKGELTTSSTETLNNMYFPISIETFLLGDGKYTGSDGRYYMHSDAGIMRNVLYYGVFGLLFIFVGQMQFFFKPIKILLGKLKSKLRYTVYNDLLFLILLIAFVLLLHYKGEVMLYMPIVQIILLWITLSFTNEIKKRYG